ncbi:kinase-like protein [Aspergillus vadensis CBS 113365]|uniref:Kinase-like protein n=1 Tax=Aspergillus vadensis (strain CBS 113365 / IMI 142717 / IBT 24658) TaxID=1448311 RepID=A0A319B0N7_ASPVC|nr:kinase-like protein [Aspergillus vadensis CBS 113365]PYH65675.1 kinase-like protein [Aspergillus vadensis CBS 113365]
MSAPQPGSEFFTACQNIKDNLEKHTKRRCEPASRFISHQDLLEIWQTEDRIHKVLYTDRRIDDDLQNIQDNFIAILSTLVSIEATHCLANFRSLFLAGNITDKDLPLEREQIETFLPDQSELVDQFEIIQCEFCPTVISCTTPLHCVSSKRRLPFEIKPEKLGIGGFGEVELVTITPRYWETASKSYYNFAYKVACKKFDRKEAFLREHKNLTILKESLTTQSHILQHYTAVDHDPHNYYILFPYAEHGDLHHFLYGGAGSYEIHNQFPGIPEGSDTAIFKPLLYQCWALACAIQWLHDYIQVDGEHIMCAHLDLKPDNILIRNDASSVVGKWMISDFGISVLEPQKLGSSRPLSVRGCYQEPTIEVNPHRGRGTYRPPEAIIRRGSTVTADKIGRRSDIWAYGCIFTEVLAWAIGRREGVEHLAKERQTGATNDCYWDEQFAQSLSPQTTGFKVRDSVVRWLEHNQNSTERVVGEWVKTIKDILIIDKEHRPKAQQLVEYVRGVYKSCDLPQIRDSQPPESPAEPPFRQPSYRMPDPREFPRESGLQGPSKLLPHGKKHVIDTYMSRTSCQGKVPIAVVCNDKVEILNLDLTQKEIEEVGFLSLFGKLGNAEVAIEGQYLAVWGFCKGSRKGEGGRVLHIGEVNSGFETSLPIVPELVVSVAVSPRGLFALVQDKDIILLSWPSQSSSDVRRTLALPVADQSFTQAIFNASGDFLFVWARSSKQESLYVWKVEGMADEPDFAVHYSLQHRFHWNTSVMPYSSGKGCVLADDQNRYTAVTLNQQRSGTHSVEPARIERPFDTLNVIVSCMIGDEYLLGLVKSGHLITTRLYLHRFEITRRENQTHASITRGREVLEVPKDFKQASNVRAYEQLGVATVVLWNETSFFISDLPPSNGHH